MPINEPTNSQKHQGGRHLVLAEVLLRGTLTAARSGYLRRYARSGTSDGRRPGGLVIADIDTTTALTCERVILVDVTNGRRDFYVVEGADFRAGVPACHEAFLQQQGGTRPRNPDSKHTAVRPGISPSVATDGICC
ncbi:hypothetical protein ACPXCP_34025 [Streptomyces sp. DT20]|uniref:hypothetical protein n=1 Tax=Streptomyces sp. DT20 TaxID=3416519 RepID=UPI003CEA10E5